MARCTENVVVQREICYIAMPKPSLDLTSERYLKLNVIAALKGDGILWPLTPAQQRR